MPRSRTLAKAGTIPCNADDNIYNGGGDQLLLNLEGDNTNGYTSTFNVGLDLTDTAVGAADSMGDPVEVRLPKPWKFTNRFDCNDIRGPPGIVDFGCRLFMLPAIPE